MNARLNRLLVIYEAMLAGACVVLVKSALDQGSLFHFGECVILAVLMATLAYWSTGWKAEKLGSDDRSTEEER
jgi:hypothetical protein